MHERREYSPLSKARFKATRLRLGTTRAKQQISKHVGDWKYCLIIFGSLRPTALMLEEANLRGSEQEAEFPLLALRVPLCHITMNIRATVGLWQPINMSLRDAPYNDCSYDLVLSLDFSSRV